MSDKRQDDLDYLYRTLSELSDLAARCGEAGIALVLNTIVVVRTGSAADGQLAGKPPGPQSK